jgi:hypothetical protein
MATFSERLGITPPRGLQIESMDRDLRTGVWNWVHRACEGADEYWIKAAESGLWDQVMKMPLDEIPGFQSETVKAMKKWFFATEWYRVYEFVEFALPRVNGWRRSHDPMKRSIEDLNEVLAREMSGYRLMKGQFVPITNPTEMAEISRASNRVSGFDGVAQHIQTAVGLLAKKPDPDYRNSIKESISAVEAAVKTLTGEKSGGIDTALAILERKGKLHGALKVALSKLYAYTSDEGGIRHAMLDDPNTTFAEAKFMLVACSAFANLLIETAA